MGAEKNLRLMKTLDDSWNAQDLSTFRKRHAKDRVVRWPNQPPTLGLEAHAQKAQKLSEQGAIDGKIALVV